MLRGQPYIGIDFGTTKSAAAWFNPETNRPEILLNAEGEQTTPSAVYYGQDEVVVGEGAVQQLPIDGENRRVVVSVKRNLVQQPLIALPGRPVRAIDVAAAIIGKLRRDADEYHFHAPVERAVVTCPASFDALQQDKIAEAARLAGLKEVELLPEPIAAALAYTEAGLDVGDRVLVYDLGGGTFDVALLVREPDGSFRLGLEPKGLQHSGGDDYDRALYDYCEQQAYERLRGSISRDGLTNLGFLALCRARKEHLSNVSKADLSTLVQVDGQMVPFAQTIERSTLEALIDERIRSTVRLTADLIVEAQEAGEPIDTLVLVGGSSRIPLVSRLLQESLPPDIAGRVRKWHLADLAVALGAAYHAHALWGAEPMPEAGPEPPREPTPAERYGEAVEAAASHGPLDEAALTRLDELVAALGLDAEAAAAIERRIMGTTRDEQRASRVKTETAEQVSAQGDEPEVEKHVETEGVSVPPPEMAAQERYQDAVRLAWADGRLHADEAAALGRLAEQLELMPDTVAGIERSIMGATREEIQRRQGGVQYRPVPVSSAFPVRELGAVVGALLTFIAVFLPAYEHDNYWGEGFISGKFLILACIATVIVAVLPAVRKYLWLVGALITFDAIFDLIAIPHVIPNAPMSWFGPIVVILGGLIILAAGIAGELGVGNAPVVPETASPEVRS